MKSVLTLVALVTLSSPALAQTAPTTPKFLAADISLRARTGTTNQPTMTGGVLRGGRYDLRNATMLDLMELVRQVPVASHVKDYAVRLVMATHTKTENAAPIANQYLRFGSSPRGGQALVLAGKVRALVHGRFNVSFDDIHAVAAPALRHRLILNFEAEAEGITTDHIISQILNDVPREAAVAV